MTDELGEQRKKPRIVHSPKVIDGGDATEEDFNYFAYAPSDRLVEVKKKIEEREKFHFELTLLNESLDGNPEPGEHQDNRTVGPDKTPVACPCGRCELKRAKKLVVQTEYVIRKLRALYVRLQ